MSPSTQTEIKLSWLPIDQERLRGQLKHYTVAYQEVGRLDLDEKSNGGSFLVQPSSAKRQHSLVSPGEATIDNLNPFGNYSFMMSAETKAGPGPFSYPVFCTTRAHQTAGPPGAIKVTPSDRSDQLQYVTTLTSLRWLGLCEISPAKSESATALINNL